MNHRYRYILKLNILLLTVLLAGGNVMAQVQVNGSVYGGGNLADVKVNTEVNMSGGTVNGNVFGGGKGKATNFQCDKAMVGESGDGSDTTPGGTNVTITGGTVMQNVYGGGEVGRVEKNTIVTIGVENETEKDTKSPVINGSVFGAGQGKETHGYSALVRGNSTVTIQGNAKVLQNVYGGGEQATVGRYWVKGVNDNVTGAPTAPTDTPDEMPYQTMSGGKCTVVVQGSAQIGPDDAANISNEAGHVFGAGKGVTPNYVHTGDKANWSRRMVDYNSEKHTGTPGTTWDYYPDDHSYVWEYFATEDKYFEFLQTLALVTGTDVTINGSAKVKGSVYGGSESGYVQDNTDVKVKGGTIGTDDQGGADYGNVYGGGKGDADHTGANHNYVAAGLVKGNTKVKIENGTILHNVYGGGAYGTVGEFDYDNTTGLPTGRKTYTVGETVQFTTGGNTEVYITGGTIGKNGDENGMVFGSSRGDVGAIGSIHDKLAWVYDTHVAIGDTINTTVTTATPLIRGSIYGGGENGHNFRNSYVRINGGTIGILEGESLTSDGVEYSGAAYPYRGNVYGGGCGTDKYNDGNGDKFNPKAGIVQGNAFVNITAGYVAHNVYGAGAMGSVGSGTSGGKTTVTVSGGRIGYDGNRNGNVFGAARGEYGISIAGSNLANVRETAVNINYATTPTADDEDKTVQLITGSVFGGGEAGTVKENVAVNMMGGLVLKDVYGGGALAHTQTSNWDTSANSDAGGWADTDRKSTLHTTTVRLTGGRVGEEVFGGGLGEAEKPAYVYGDVLVELNNNNNGGDVIDTQTGCIVDQIFGANNVNGTPKGNVTVHVYGTQNQEKATIADKFALDKIDLDKGEDETAEAYLARLKTYIAGRIDLANALEIETTTYQSTYDNSSSDADDFKTAINGINSAINAKGSATINALRYDVKAVYGGGNQATYEPVSPYTTSNTSGAKTQVIIDGCSTTSIETVYGGGNAAAVPETNVTVNAAYEIGSVFGGGNGKDDIAPGVPNPGADVGTKDHGVAPANNYGTGNANTVLKGGYIHEAYGGSNQKGKIVGMVNINTDPVEGGCPLDVEKLVGAGKNADVDGDLIMILGCKPTTKTPLVFAGADNANVNGNVELTITSGTFGQVFGGNNLGGIIKGHIVLNIEETGCNPIKIDELYLGGNEAAYSIYGYYDSGTTDSETGKPIYLPRSSENDTNTAVENPDNTDEKHPFPYSQPVLNIVSCTSIGKVFGGGLGAPATMYANPTVNINMINGTATGSLTTLGTIGDVYGGGNEAMVEGNTTINIGTETEVQLHNSVDDNGNYTMSSNKPVLGANITGNVYGGGNLANVTGNTFVNICAKYNEETEKYVAVPEGDSKVIIGGTVYGGGKGIEDTFTCEKAMIGENGHGADNPDYPNGNTNVRIGHGTVNGSVYGGGQVGRVEMNTLVEIGYGDGGAGTKSPVIGGNVFGAGAGVKTHGYSALVRGNTQVTIAGDAWVKKSVYGGGEIASVARYKVAQSDEEGAPYGVEEGEPYLLENPNSGYCYVTVKGHAEIGTDGMKMYHKENGTISSDDKPDDWGHVFAAGKGVLPETYNFNNFTAADRKNYPKRMALYDSKKYKATEENVTWEYVDPDHKETNKNIWEYFNTEAKYFTFVQTLGLATQTEATIDGNALVKGSVYGGSENGLVQFDTNVKIKGSCQIGVAEAGKPDCAHWDFTAPYAPYDPYAKYLYEGKYYYDVDHTKDAAGGAKIATDGHTYYGNVFGGGSGSVPYFNTIEGKSEYISSAGTVKGNTYVTISGGHILSNVYGGCEATNVLGTANVTMTNGTVGVERTDEQIIALPLTGYIFGGGKGDQRIFFNKETNVNHSIVKIEGGRVYGSVYGGGEDGHVLGNVTMTIGKTGNTGPTIGTRGTSYYDGHVFGGGRGFGGEALTAGNVGGAVTLDILGGSILGNVYGGGRLASVGYGLYLTDEEGYGEMRADNQYDGSYTNPSTEDASAFYNKGRGKIFVTVSGGTIGNDVDNAEYGGHVFGGSMGRLSKLDGNPFSDPNHWQLLATAKQTTVNVTNGVIKRSVFGGGEMGTITENTNVTVSGGTIGTLNKGAAEFGNVYGGGKGLTTETLAGVVKGNTIVTINGTNESPKIYHNIYGGGAYGSVGTFDLSAGMPVNWTENTGKCTVTVNGGDIGTTGKENGMIFGSSRGDVATPVDGVDPNDKLAWVYDTHVTIGTQDSNDGPQVNGSVYGSGENGHVYTNTLIDIHSGTIGITDTSIDGGARYAYRGNVYGGGCGTDTYDVVDNEKTFTKYNPLAGIVYGKTTVNMDGGHVVHNVYGAGAMGSVGKFVYDGTTKKPLSVEHFRDGKYVDATTANDDGYDPGTCYVTIRGGKIGTTDMKMINTTTGEPDNYGHVFGAGRGELHDPADYPNLEVSGYVNNTNVEISGTAFVTGSVYGGGESGHVLGNTNVTVSGGQIGCGVGKDAAYSDADFTNAFDPTTGDVTTPLAECASWDYNDDGATYDKYADQYDSKGGKKVASDGHTFYGNVFGGGSGYTPYSPGNWLPKAGLVEGNTTVTITDGHILTSVYGGNEQTDVNGSCTVSMSGGTVGVPRTHPQRQGHPVTGNVFGAGKGDKRILFNTWTNVGSTIVNISGGTVYGSVFGGGEDGHVLGDASTTISGSSTVIGTLGTSGSDGNVFGGGRGSVTALTAGVVSGNVSLAIQNGLIKGSVYGGGRLASVGTYLVPTDNSNYGKQIPDGDATHGHVAITISGGTIGALDGDKVKESSNSIGDVFGGCKGTTEGELHEVLGVSKSAIVNLLGGTVGNSIYGGGEVGNVGERGENDPKASAFAKVNLLGGSVKNVYGGGLGKKTSTIDAKALVKGDVTVNLNGLEAGDYDAAIHSGSVSQANVEGEAVYYRVADGDNSGCVVNGTIFGCNNINGTPEGHAKVHVFKTTKRSGQATVGLGDDVPNAYDVVAVYGGGNQADYVPTNADPQKRTEVIIEGCDRTSIHNVYGGGNAAASPGTLVTVKGSKMIYEVFGGGNGVSTEGFENPGANIGFRTDRTLEYKDKEGNVIGDGKALVQLMSGNIKYAYGGSNTKGDIRGTSNVVTVDNEYIKNPTACCEELVVDHMFGGGKNAGMKSGANIILGCSNSSTWVKEIYAGAENADVLGDVSLTITSGKFGRVFGGNKTSGKLEGSITVNIEENGQCGIPVIIGELYGGGNKAAYSIYGFDGDTPRTKEQYNALSDAQKAAIDLEQPHHSPVVNVRAFTSIGNIFGGGYGDEAVMYGDPTVNINEVPITHTDDDATYSGNQYTGETLYFVNDVLDPTRTATTTQEGDYILTLPDHEDQKMGAINNVFGGGNAAAVYGNTLVNIAVTSEEPLQQLDEQGNPKYTDVAKTIPEKVNKEVKGADIRGNVYGGGNEAEVTGNTNVIIGRQETPASTSPARSSDSPSESQHVTP